MAKVVEANNHVGGDSSDEEDEFVDATDKIAISNSSSVTLHQGIVECYQAMELFLNNRFEEAKHLLAPLKDKSMYHALGYGTNLFLQAMLTFDEADIEAGKEATKQAAYLINKCRHKSSILSRTDYNSFTSEELHAELCYAESLIHRTLLTFIQDENLISFIKGGLRMRQCHLSYKECIKLLQKRKFTENDEKMHFESGTRMGDGLSNLMLSLLPAKVLKLLEFIGFSGSKVKGLNELELGYNLEKSLRGPLCALALLTYHVVISFFVGTDDGDIVLCDKIMKQCLKTYSKSAIFLFFAGRLEEVKGNIRDAIYRFEESVDAQQEWKNFQHLCFWELMWCHAFQGDWVLSMKYAERLCNESKWSKATYMYQKACFLMMCDEQTDETKKHIDYLLGEVPKLKQRIAGKSIPVEKFAVYKALRYFEQQRALVLPAYELFFIWNNFTIFGRLPEYINPILNALEKALVDIESTKDKRKYYADDKSLALLLKGVCLRYKQQFDLAAKHMKEVIQSEKDIKSDNYLVPYAHHELALIYIAQAKYNEAKVLLDRVKKDYKGYQIESRLHMRLHSASMKLKKAQGEMEDGGSTAGEAPTATLKQSVATDERL